MWLPPMPPPWVMISFLIGFSSNLTKWKEVSTCEKAYFSVTHNVTVTFQKPLHIIGTPQHGTICRVVYRVHYVGIRYMHA
jgi:hypothetical protein